ncbi:PAS domain-containing protein [Agrobacterium tumefaciens]|uniref:PAS domain-containing protein n=1 Tax=Agrobacterium tumefaciens TaxID=358 RepID=UPI0015747FCC|nr:PAS domain-containing protein [Agrobacterium tumefaciens]NTD87571.1 PAS domain-containing protein [Agrobacterium tumefaciens]NTD92642.1 PAS domain-containing protein [Agrobacterium tumefaciens]NTD97066.1 PAS domain-containing protein [Agrobacterium tumefaciens]NTE14972.1 PAS domain-containing protein [Agrobacterium tumefaciens]NTE27142.1 PAS domain-containing protein [Agrobacterium tumefaciens]
MLPGAGTTISVIPFGHGMGFYTWDVIENKLYGDPNVAELYGFLPEELARGIDVERIFAIILDSDRALIAANVHKAILTGEPSSGQFRVLRPDGLTRSIVSFGRCLRDDEGNPTFYTGTVMDASSSNLFEARDPLEWYCRAALSVAKSLGNDLAARYLSSALNVLQTHSKNSPTPSSK